MTNFDVARGRVWDGSTQHFSGFSARGDPPPFNNYMVCEWFGKYSFMELLLDVCLLVAVFSGTKTWSSEAPEYQAAGKKILL